MPSTHQNTIKGANTLIFSEDKLGANAHFMPSTHQNTIQAAIHLHMTAPRARYPHLLLHHRTVGPTHLRTVAEDSSARVTAGDVDN